MEIIWSSEALEDFCALSASSKKRAKVKRFLKEILEKGPMTGSGKPERLKGDFAGCFSRRIDKANRLVYRIREGKLEILSCKGHYNDR